MRVLSEIKQTIVDHLLQQDQAAIERGVCLYKTSKGLKCAVGCLIPDECYEKEIEGVSLFTTSSLDESPLVEVLKCSEIDLQLPGVMAALLDAQSIHDKHSPLEWKRLLADFSAKDHADCFAEHITMH